MARHHLHAPRPVLSVALAALMTVAGLAPATAAAAGPSASAPSDEIRLNSGGFVRGQLQALMPGQYVEILKHDGNVQRFEWSEVQSVVRSDGSVIQGGTAAAAPTETTTEPTWEPEPTDAGGTDPGQDYAASQPAATGAEAPPAYVPPSGPPAPSSWLGPTVEISVNRKGPPVSLYRLGDPTQALCEAPCNQPIKAGYLYVASNGKRIGKGFELMEDVGAYQVAVKRPSPFRRWGGVALIPLGLAVGIGIGIIPALHNVPKAKVGGYAAGGTLIALAGVGGGVTLLMFSRSKVELLPQTGQSRELD